MLFCNCLNPNANLNGAGHSAPPAVPPRRRFPLRCWSDVTESRAPTRTTPVMLLMRRRSALISPAQTAACGSLSWLPLEPVHQSQLAERGN